jgi:hypothetical protein
MIEIGADNGSGPALIDTPTLMMVLRAVKAAAT